MSLIVYHFGKFGWVLFGDLYLDEENMRSFRVWVKTHWSLAHLWAKVHLILGQCRGALVVENHTDSCKAPPLKIGSFWPHILGAWIPKFRTSIFISGLLPDVVKLGSFCSVISETAFGRERSRAKYECVHKLACGALARCPAQLTASIFDRLSQYASNPGSGPSGVTQNSPFLPIFILSPHEIGGMARLSWSTQMTSDQCIVRQLVLH